MMRTVTVLGAGTMGAQIAAHAANAGFEVRVLDVSADAARDGMKRAAALRPDPFFTRDHGRAIRTGSFETDLDAACRADWVIEAVVERLDVKQSLFARVEAARAPHTIVTSNTSGIPIGALAEGRSEGFRRHFLGTHFFNPPRHSRLLEVIPTEATDPAAVAWVEGYGSRHLGKGAVRAKDRPAFIGNRLGVHGLLSAVRLAESMGLGPDQMDEITGSLIGRPRSATFRTLDLVGLDVGVAVAEGAHADLADDPEREAFAVPASLRTLVDGGSLGEKTGAGYFRREGREILALDLASGEYRPRRPLEDPVLARARTERDLRRRLSLLVDAEGPVGEVAWRLLSASLVYAARVAEEVAGDAVSVDRAMRWGFGWELGPFEIWDALGVARVAGRIEREGGEVPDLVRRVLDGPGAFRPDAGAGTVTFPALTAERVPPRAGSVDLAALKAARPLPSSRVASLVELADGILGVELHGKLNVIGPDTLEMLNEGLRLAAERYDGLVIGTDAPDFSAGADLRVLLADAEAGAWDAIERMIGDFQDNVQAIRYSPVPVVACPRGRVLGGGAEICLAAVRRQPLTETQIGLVEIGVGLIPAGGGTTAMARWAAEQSPPERYPSFRAAVETIANARVSTSARDARELGFLDRADLLTADPDRQWLDAARAARRIAESGFRPPKERPITVLGRRGLAAAEALTFNQLAGGHMSEHDRRIVLDVARVMSGGDVAEGSQVREGYLLDLEREAFLALLGEPLTRERIKHMLTAGKALRN